MGTTSIQYWLLKSKPDNYSIDDLRRETTTAWEGVRNFQARNYMRDVMQVGDGILFYHSTSLPSGVAGIAQVCSKTYPDPTQFDSTSNAYDSKATMQRPIWWLVDVAFVEKFPQIVPLETLKSELRLRGMSVVKRGNRLSVQPVEKTHFAIVRELGRSR